ncbi:MAG: DUF4435 domain-containing protein [Muribaculaceae bacterium]
MKITLPKRSGGEPLQVDNARQVTVIGANGAGKSRFCMKLLEDAGDRAYRMSALKGILSENYHNDLPGSIERQFEERQSKNPLLCAKANTEFERLMVLLMSDEFVELLGYKTQKMLLNTTAEMPATKLDSLVRNWQAIFPRNKILRQSGRLLFTNASGDKPYATLRLSDGEKAALYYIGAALYAPQGALILVDAPETFIHRSIMQSMWNVIEEMRPDCTFVYSTHDIEFASSRVANTCIWIKNYDAQNETWEYEEVNPNDTFTDELYFDLLGSRKPILFIEGDNVHSIDSKLYPLVFTEYTVKPMGSCDKVIEATRAFNDLKSFHNLDGRGIVDRDRRDDREVEYLRTKRILVPNVAEVENLLMLEPVVRAVATYRGKDPDKVANRVKRNVVNMFRAMQTEQALEHVRHRVKRNVEVRIDKRFPDISALEKHMIFLINEIKPRELYEDICAKFKQYADTADYQMVLKVFNEKTMLTQSGVAQLCGLVNKDAYIKTVLNILKRGGNEANDIRKAIMQCFGVDDLAK